MLPTPPQPDLLIVIVNYRTPAMTIDCLHALLPELQSMPENARVVVVDNGSADGSADAIHRAIIDHHWQPTCELLPLDHNLGFAGGNNRGIACYPDARYVLLLNSDTLMHPGTLRHCLDLMHARTDIGALACRLLSADGSPQTMARRFPTPLRHTLVALGLPWWLPRWFAHFDPEYISTDHHHHPREVDWLGGAFLLLRGEALQAVGQLDEDFFFYGEDIELCHRLHRHHYTRYYDPRVTITHFGGASADENHHHAPRQNPAYWHARYLVQRKCFGRLAAAWLRILDLLSLSLRLIVMRARGLARSQRYQRDAAAWRLLRKPLST
ncbi:glycosyltransferase family 2 protein [Phycisphaerales bacterium AB-hyl4]|uniref:Glycosyltransferase family 2 protein n=1 Tax=Natronomicrosphaera hydrolytica TaxID=3242702 RepID=A0ABV4U7H7_9BACT